MKASELYELATRYIYGDEQGNPLAVSALKKLNSED